MSDKITKKEKQSALQFGSQEQPEDSEEQITIRENIITSTLKYVQFWTMISREKPDLLRLDQLNLQIRTSYDQLIKSWDLCRRRGAVLSKNTYVLLVQYFVEVSNQREIGFGILRDHPEIARLPDFKAYDLQNKQLRGAETKESFREEFEKVFKNNFSRSIKVMKIAIFIMFLILALFNFFDLKYSKQNLQNAHNMAEVLSQTNKLHSEMQNLASFVIDVHAYTNQALTIFEIQYLEHDHLNNLITTSCQNVDQIIEQLYSLNKEVVNDQIFSRNITLMASAVMTLNSTGGSSNSDSNNGMDSTSGPGTPYSSYTTSLINATKTLVGEARLLAAQKTGVKISNLHQENFIIENALNSHYESVLNAYWDVKAQFISENSNSQEMLTLIYVLSGFFLFSTGLVLIVILVRGMSQREQVYAWLFKIPFSSLQIMIVRCLNLLQLSGVQEIILNQIRSVISEQNKDLKINSESANLQAGIGGVQSVDASGDNLNVEEDLPELIRQKTGFFNTGKIERVLCIIIVFMFLHSYYLINFMVQNYLIQDIEIFVEFENLDVLDQSFYLVNANGIKTFLLERADQVNNKNSYTFVEQNMKVFQQIDADIEQIKGEISFGNLQDQYVEAFISSKFCENQQYFLVQECISNLKAMGVQIDFISISLQFSRNLEYLVSNIDKELAQNQNTLTSMFKLSQYQQMATLSRFYINQYLGQQKAQFQQILADNNSLTFQLRLVQYAIYLIFQIIFICCLWLPVINRTNNDIQRARSFLNLIPVYSI